MGWSFGWNSKKELVDHLSKPFETGGGITKTLAKTVKGNHLWMVIQHPGRPPVIVLALLGYGKRDGWGYKDMEEGMGPRETDVPLKFLDMAPPNDPYGWREKVLAHYARAGKLSKLKPGMRVRLVSGITVRGTPVTGGVVQSVKPLVIISEEYPGPLRMKKTYVAEVLPGSGVVAGGKRRHGKQTVKWMHYPQGYAAVLHDAQGKKVDAIEYKGWHKKPPLKDRKRTEALLLAKDVKRLLK